MKIDAALVARLVRTQFPHWSGLPIVAVEPNGWDNRTFRLGQELLVRLPSAERYAAQVRKEHCWLPLLAPHVPLSIPVPVAMGESGEGYPWNWSVYQWLDGTPASAASIVDISEFAAGNLLVRDGRLAAVIDFGRSGVGDPACDLVPWKGNLLTLGRAQAGTSRRSPRSAYDPVFLPRRPCDART